MTIPEDDPPVSGKRLCLKLDLTDLEVVREEQRRLERHVAARRERIKICQDELAAGEKFVKQWLEQRRAFLSNSIATDLASLDTYERSVRGLAIHLTRAEKRRKAERLRAEIARLEREVAASESGGRIDKALQYTPPLLDHLGDGLGDLRKERRSNKKRRR